MNFIPFIEYCQKHIKGDEKGEAQTFLDHFFTALGYDEGYKGAGADCEYRIKNQKKKTTSFADLVWKPRVLIEMKKGGEDLSIHLQQAFSYWSQLVPNRPNYVILCNFDEFWIYDFNKDIYEPQEKIDLEKLEQRKEAFTFLLPKEKKPLFKTDREDVTADAAKFVSYVYKSLTDKNRNPLVNKEDAMHYCLQCVLCMYAEDIDLLPGKIFTRLIEECLDKEGSGYDKIPESYDLIGGLFKEMNSKGITPAGKYKDVDYFNGGLFDKIIPIELTKREIELMDVACTKNWQHINPAIFGAIFEGNMDEKERHNLGAHYTNEIDIKKIVDPVIVQPWRQKIDAVLDKHNAKEREITSEALKQLHIELCNYKVLDPACGSGNFLFIAYKELKLIEKEILKHFKLIAGNKISWDYAINCSYVSTKQFFGIDLNPNAVELAKVTLMIAKEMSIKEAMDKQETLPLDNLDVNIICTDALFTAWPQCDVIIGNPPYQSKNKMQQEFGAAYINKLREAYPEVSGRADFCVYWFYKAHKHLQPNHFAGLVGTNTIRQNYSREGSLDYIVNNGGEIINAVSSVDWSGEAAVFVSIVSWTKGKYSGEKLLYTTDKNEELQRHVEEIINSSLSLNTDVTTAKILHCNRDPKKVFQGQTHGHEGFLLTKAEGVKLLNKNPEYKDVLKPFLVGEELVGNKNAQPGRFVIDFSQMDILKASTYKDVYKIIEKTVLPERETRGKEQEEVNKELLRNNPKAKVNKHHINFYRNWWKLSYGREEMLKERDGLKRYIACARVTQRPIFEFFESFINPNDKVMAFMFEDDYSFGIIQSGIHWKWFLEKCTTLGETPNYNSAAIWDTFPWPQNPTETQIRKVASTAKALHTQRTAALRQYNMSLRNLYRLLEQPGANPIKDLHTALDKAVMEAYGFDNTKDILSQLLALNLAVAEKENKKEKVQPPGLPEFVRNKEDYVSDECVRFEWG
jgi:type I restriction-modification system DNA methylase subunit